MGVVMKRRNYSRIFKKGIDEEGFTLLEIIVAISILTIGILAVASMQGSSIRGNDLAGDLSEASCIATDQMEKLIQEDYEDVVSSASPVTQGIYSINWNVAENEVYNDTKTVTMVVSWTLRGAAKSVTVRRVIPRVI